MEPRLLFLILFCLIIGLLHVIAFWRRKAGETAYAAARNTRREYEREYYCRMAVMAGHKEACRMYCIMHSDFFEDQHLLKPYKFKGMNVTFFGHYYPSRFGELLDIEQRRFCEELYSFKDGKNDGQNFFRLCMEAIKTGKKTYHVMFMPCSSHEKYVCRFRQLDKYITSYYPNLTSGFGDIDLYGYRESLHKAKGNENRKLSRNYRITGNISGKEVIIMDDVLTTGQSLNDYRREIESCGGKVTAALFYGKTVEMPHPFIVKIVVWSSHIGRLFTD